ncbi:MAG TPA: redoxin domain-containing protein [Candidatus Eisenbacteria bacterium]|nr:redoxin domain-containing protein [Candidatus Eisenbacteria bacterium]
MNRSGKRRAGAAAAAAILLGLAGLLAIGAKPKPAPTPKSSGLRVAPPIDLESWINTKRLKPADLDGKVRVIEFWTLGSAHCQNSVLAMRELYGLYAKKGALVVGVHSPMSPRERDSVAVAGAVAKNGIRFPVALDSDRKAFDAFKNRDWPILYLLDRKGVVRATHVGELQVGTRAWNNFRAAVDSVLAWKTERRS